MGDSGPGHGPSSRCRRGAGDTKAAARRRGGRHLWPGGHASAGRDGRWRLVRRPLGWQPWPGPARPTRRADGATPTLDRQDGNGGQRRIHANPARMVIDRRSDAQRPSPTRRRTQGNRHATRTHRRGQVAGSPDRGRAGDGDSNQLLAVPRGHRPHGGGWQRVEVTVSLTLLAVARSEPGWPQPDRYHRWAAVLVVAHSAGALVAVGLPPLRLPWLGWRPQVGSTRSGSGLAPPTTSWLAAGPPACRSSPRPPPRAFPANPAPSEHPLGVAGDGWSGYAQLRSPLPRAGGLGPGPL